MAGELPRLADATSVAGAERRLGGVTASRDATSDLGRLIFGNSLLALIVAVALGALTIVMELLLARGRTNLRLRTSGTGPGGRGPF